MITESQIKKLKLSWMIFIGRKWSRVLLLYSAGLILTVKRKSIIFSRYISIYLLIRVFFSLFNRQLYKPSHPSAADGKRWERGLWWRKQYKGPRKTTISLMLQEKFNRPNNVLYIQIMIVIYIRTINII